MSYPVIIQLIANRTSKLQNNPFQGINGAVFLGWNTKRDGSGNWYENRSNINFSSDTTLFAQWGFPVKWDSMGGTTQEDSICRIYESLKEIPVPIKQGFIFDGWFTEINGGGDKLTPDTEINSPITFYANWIQVDDDALIEIWSGNENSIITSTDDNAIQILE